MRMRVPNLLISKFIAIDANSSCAVVCCSISSLSHKTFNDSMENTVFVMFWLAFFTCADSSEILCSLWNLFRKKFKHYSSLFLFKGFGMPYFDIKESLCICLIKIWQFFMNALCDFFIIINSTRKHIFHSCCLRFVAFLFLSL